MSEQKSETFDVREKDWSARVQCSGVARLANDLYAMLDERDAQNYIELRFESPKGGTPIIVTIHRPGGKTPHEFRLEAEAEAARLRAELDALRSLPAVPPSPAERLDLDPESLAEAMCAAEFGSAAWGSHPDDGPLRRRFRTRANYVIEWFSAYRAAKPGSTGAAPPAAEPATCGTCGGDGLALTPIGSTKKCPECSPGGAA